MKKQIIFLIGILSLCLTGCNKAAHDVQPLYISGYSYENKSCDGLKRELNYVEERENAMAQRVDDRKSSQDMKLAFGWLFWPSYFVIDNNDAEAQELSKLRGEYNSISRVLESKKCVSENK